MFCLRKQHGLRVVEFVVFGQEAVNTRSMQRLMSEAIAIRLEFL